METQKQNIQCQVFLILSLENGFYGQTDHKSPALKLVLYPQKKKSREFQQNKQIKTQDKKTD